MNIKSSNPPHTRVMWIAVALALITAFSYILRHFHLLGVGDLQVNEKPSCSSCCETAG
jgi:hypothetical protein